MISDFINVIGVGQCGTRLGQEFERMGIQAAFINSDEVDVRGISSKKGNMLLIDTRGTAGAPSKGRQMIDKKKKDLDALSISSLLLIRSISLLQVLVVERAVDQFQWFLKLFIIVDIRRGAFSRFLLRHRVSLQLIMQ